MFNFKYCVTFAWITSRCRFRDSSFFCKPLFSAAYEPLKLMQTVMAKTNEICLRYLDNSMLCSLPSPGVPHNVVSVCAAKNKRRRMEDRHVVIHDLNTMFNIQVNRKIRNKTVNKAVWCFRKLVRPVIMQYLTVMQVMMPQPTVRLICTSSWPKTNTSLLIQNKLYLMPFVKLTLYLLTNVTSRFVHIKIKGENLIFVL